MLESSSCVVCKVHVLPLHVKHHIIGIILGLCRGIRDYIGLSYPNIVLNQNSPRTSRIAWALNLQIAAARLFSRLASSDCPKLPAQDLLGVSRQ